MMDLRTGPTDSGFGPDVTLACDFIDKKFGGHTPKFGCVLNPGDVLKVRYGRDNGEVYAGVAATRLLWVLGFGADPMFPVRIECRHCPEKLQGEGIRTRDETRFDIAAVERKFPGTEIEASGIGPGWSWQELGRVDPQLGGASLAQRDALKLLAVVLQHSDNKADQQRIVCRDGKHSDRNLASCDDPFLLIHDVGQTFGRANRFNRSSVGSVNFELWSHTSVWKDSVRCVGNLAPAETSSLSDPTISEEGRKFLADLLMQLTDQQLVDLFSVARFDSKPHGGAPVEAWVTAFKAKRLEITSRRCS